MVQWHVAPAVGVHDGVVKLDMDMPHSGDVRVTASGGIGIVDQVIELGQAEVAAQHDLPPLAYRESCRPRPAARSAPDGESLEYIGGRVADIVSPVLTRT